ncbi:sugar phosphate nucleotidyltransferase [Enterococcus nangangensis]
MKLILLSGGSGKRLWPLSNNQRSKQFIKILDNNNKLESMVQRVWHQIVSVGLDNDTYIATGDGQRSILKSQLGIDNSKIISEPSRRDTFPAIILAASYLKTVVGAKEDETIIVLPVDPYVDIAFFEKIIELEDLLDRSNATVGLIGISPKFPSEKYGYIVPESMSSFKVNKFIEKPSKSTAIDLINQGAVWNAGVFSFKLANILNIIKTGSYSTNYFDLVKQYDFLPENSFDYEFVEKQNNIAFLRYDGYWKDLGTWSTLTEEMDTRSVGYTSELIDCNNTHIINETQVPIAAIGVNDLVIAAGPEGILVSKKDESHRIKELSKSVFKSVHYVEDDWGVRRILTKSNSSYMTLYEILDKKKLCLHLDINQQMIRLSGKASVVSSGNNIEITGIQNFNFVVITEEQL